MSWRDIVRKSHCMAKAGEPCECSECMKKSRKPDYLDFDKDGNKEEPMVNALEDAKKAKVKCPQCKGKGCKHCDNKGYHDSKPRGRGFTR